MMAEGLEVEGGRWGGGLVPHSLCCICAASVGSRMMEWGSSGSGPMLSVGVGGQEPYEADPKPPRTQADSDPTNWGKGRCAPAFCCCLHPSLDPTAQLWSSRSRIFGVPTRGSGCEGNKPHGCGSRSGVL